MRRVETDPVVISAAVIDGINRYLGEVLEHHGLLNEERVAALGEDELLRLKYEIAAQVADRWRVYHQSDS